MSREIVDSIRTTDWRSSCWAIEGLRAVVLMAPRSSPAPSPTSMAPHPRSRSERPETCGGRTRIPAPGSPPPSGNVGFSLPVGPTLGEMIGAVTGSVLIVDDDSAFRGLARRILSACGFTVVGEAANVKSAGEAATALRPDALLVDVMLPDGDGVALARELTVLPWSPRVVLTSSYPDAASEKEIDGCGAIAFVPKQELPTAPLRRLLGGT